MIVTKRVVCMICYRNPPFGWRLLSGTFGWDPVIENTPQKYRENAKPYVKNWVKGIILMIYLTPHPNLKISGEPVKLLPAAAHRAMGRMWSWSFFPINYRTYDVFLLSKQCARDAASDWYASMTPPLKRLFTYLESISGSYLLMQLTIEFKSNSGLHWIG